MLEKLDKGDMTSVGNETENTYYGIWFLPNSEIRAHGRLTVSNYYIDLALTDPYFQSLSEDRDEEVFPLIYGIGDAQEKITLFNCTGFTGSYHAKLMTYGSKHFQELDDLKFNTCTANIPYLDRWINSGNLKNIVESNGFTIKYEKPENLEIELDELKITIEFKCEVPHRIKSNKLTLQEHVLLHFFNPTGEHVLLTKFLNYVSFVQQFASFLVRDGANISFIRVYDSVEQLKLNPYLGTMVFTVNTFNRFERSHFSERFLINYSEVADNFKSILTTWIDFSEKGQHILNLILHDYFNKGPFNENRFLNLIRVLEIYHSFKYPGSTILPREEFEAKMKMIIENVPEPFQKEVQEQLNFKNELTLDMRLRSLLAEVENIRLGFDNAIDENFIKNVKHSRNYYTHYNPVFRKKALTGQALVRITESCRTLINFLILKHLGVNPELLAQKFENYFENSYYSEYYL